MKSRLPALMMPFSAAEKTTRAGNTGQGCAASPGGDLASAPAPTPTSAVCKDSGLGDGPAANRSGTHSLPLLHMPNGFEPRLYPTAPRVRSKKKRFG